MKAVVLALAAVWLSSGIAQAATHPAGLNAVTLRTQVQDVYYYPANGNAHGTVLFVPGDGGWRGFALDLAKTMAQDGFEVYGLDTKRYLESFSGKTSLSATDVMNDFYDLAGWIAPQHGRKVSLVGWSEGAGLCLLAAASTQGKQMFAGLITLGLPELNILGWRIADYLTWITKKTPNEPTFRSRDYLALVAPLRVWMLQSTKDEFVSLDKSRELFAAAVEPKRFSAIEAANHRFEGNQQELFRLIGEGLRWLNG